jgi:NADH:ubiquinone oxidoreductase subunit K
LTVALLLAAACLFALGCFGLLARRRPGGVVMAAQLLGLSTVLALLGLSQPAGQSNRGQAFALLVAIAGGAQAAVGLALAGLRGADATQEEARPGRAG